MSREPARRESPRQRLGRAIQEAQTWLLAAQNADGHWCGELEGDTILETEYVLLLHFLGRLDDPRVGKAARYVRRLQLAEGGWSIYPGGPPEVSASVKAYFVLKLAGDDPEAAHMQRARRTILELGGIEACNSFTKIYLSICGEHDWWQCPAVPPEMALLPRWCYFNLYEISSWSRAIVVPLSIVWALRPVRPVAARHGIAELRLQRDAPPADAETMGARTRRAVRLLGESRSWRTAFTLLDVVLKSGERLRLHPFRKRSLQRAEAWVTERLEDSDGLGAIFPPIVNTILALSCLGYGQDHPLVAAQIRELERLEIEEDGELRLQPCFSSIWDTALVLHGLAESGFDTQHAALQAGRRWLLEREVRRAGDWSVKAPGVEPGGWCFEYRNPFYPDCDDTAEVLTALSAFGPAANEPSMRRGIAWLLAMQNDDGGWGAFDRGIDKDILTHVPFADHNALLDPSTADVTGRVVDSLLRLGLAADAPPVARAIAFLRGQQEPDGTWYGRWGCNYIYGTWLVLTALARRAEAESESAGEGGGIAGEAWCRDAVAWLVAHQNADGGWGESPRSYDDPTQKGIGASTAAQTAWAMMALVASGIPGTPTALGPGAPLASASAAALERGAEYLLRTQLEDGSWHDEPWTATGFPRVFYLQYHLYAVYFPLMALAQQQRRRAGEALPQALSQNHTYPLAVPKAQAVEGAVR
jgi:squalene-hopene/tetraprenyl-beta-curcumene cyclase